MKFFQKLFGGSDVIVVRVLIKGRIGLGWQDTDRTLKVPVDTTLADFISLADNSGVPMSEALENSPHLSDTLMLNGERCPVEANRMRLMQDGDEVFLLAPLAGG